MPQASPNALIATQDAATRPDADLVAQLRAGDETAMARLVSPCATSPAVSGSRAASSGNQAMTFCGPWTTANLRRTFSG